MDFEQLSLHLRSLGPGQKLTYFIGFLDSERFERPKGPASQTASVAYDLYLQGFIHLVQRRLSKPFSRGQVDWRNGLGQGFEYIAIGAREVKKRR